ncbi:MAG: Octopine permease ATP-binding protein P [Gammaproteobacteria bacterium]|nr:Octopine permease ATP-binding protein P [Gammaproteobacteria bacterium]
MADIPALAVENIHKRFGELEVLKGVSLVARTGDVISMIGSSGSGKSTFLRCVNLLEIPDEGTVMLAGDTLKMTRNRKGEAIPTDRHQVDRFRTRLGMVFQNFNLWTHMTIEQNVMEAPIYVQKRSREKARELAIGVLEKVGIVDKAHQYPEQLSGGQQQRAAIARALAMEPEILLFDEPTSALDPELVGDVLRVMRQLAEEGRTMLVVTHEMGFARELSSQVIFLHQGRVEEQGPPSRVFDNPASERCRQFLTTEYK